MSTGSSKATQSINLAFDGGMDQRTHPRQTQAPTVLEAVNVRYPQLGGVEKRAGLRNLGGVFRDGYSMVPGQGRLLGFQDELIVTDKYRMGSRSVAAGTEWFVNKGKIPEATGKLTQVASTQYQVVGQDVGTTTDGLLIHAWLGGGTGLNVIIDPAVKNNGIFATVEDIATGTVISASKQLTDHAWSWWAPQVVIRNGIDIFILWGINPRTVGAGPGIFYTKWDRVTMSWSTPAILANPAGVRTFATAANGSNVYLLTIAPAGTMNLYVYDSAMALVSNNLIDSPTTTGTGQIGYGLSATNSVVWGTYFLPNDPTPAQIWGFTATAAGVLATGPFQLDSFSYVSAYPILSAPVVLPGGGALVCIQRPGGLTCPVFTAAGAVVGNATPTNRLTHWQTLASKPFVESTSPLRVYAFVYSGSAGDITTGPDGSNIASTPARFTHVLLDLVADDTASIPWAPRPITWQAPRFSIPGINARFSDAPTTYGFPPCSVSALGGSQYIADLIIVRNNNGRLSLASHVVNFSGADRMLSCQLGQTLFVSPGFYYDKARLGEISFIYHPHQVALTKTLSGGSLPDGTYVYRAIYEFVDANGFVHQSIPSDPIQVVIAGGAGAAQVKITVPCLCVTARQDAGAFDTGVRIVVYRQDLAAGTGQFIRILSQGADYLNDTTKQSVDVIDVGSSLGLREELYTDSGVFPNVTPASFTSCVTYRNRVWIAYGHTVNYSKAFVTGSTVNFTDAFELPLEETGDITAMWVMDDTLFISTVDRIYYMYADGPNDFGQQSDVNTPNRVATDFGVVDQRSVVVTQAGTLYQSRAGIQLLDRSRAVATEPIGSRMQKDLTAYPEIVAANLHPDGRVVTFMVRGTNGFGIRLVYDYSTDRWARDSLLFGNSAGQEMLSEAVAGGVQYSLAVGAGATPNKVYAEDRTTNLDDGAWVTMLINMGEVHPLGLQGNVSFLKWTINQEKKSPYDMQFTWFRDYSISGFNNMALTAAQLDAMPAYQYSFDTSVHRAQSMRIRLADSQPIGTVGTGKGASWIGLAVELDPLDNKTFKLAASQKG